MRENEPSFGRQRGDRRPRPSFCQKFLSILPAPKCLCVCVRVCELFFSPSFQHSLVVLCITNSMNLLRRSKFGMQRKLKWATTKKREREREQRRNEHEQRWHLTCMIECGRMACSCQTEYVQANAIKSSVMCVCVCFGYTIAGASNHTPRTYVLFIYTLFVINECMRWIGGWLSSSPWYTSVLAITFINNSSRSLGFASRSIYAHIIRFAKRRKPAMNTETSNFHRQRN